MAPCGVMRPIVPATLVNQRLPSGPAMISLGSLGSLLSAERGNSVMAPCMVMRPIFWLEDSVNQRFPSGPAVIPKGSLIGVGRGNSVMAPCGVTRPISLFSVNQRFPSGPAVIPKGSLLLDIGYQGLFNSACSYGTPPRYRKAAPNSRTVARAARFWRGFPRTIYRYLL